MIKHNVGLLRKIISKRHEIVAVVKQVINSDNLLILDHTGDSFNLSGHSSGTDRSLFMLGRATGMVYQQSCLAGENYPINEELTQPTAVAIAFIQKEMGIDV